MSLLNSSNSYFVCNFFLLPQRFSWSVFTDTPTKSVQLLFESRNTSTRNLSTHSMSLLKSSKWYFVLLQRLLAPARFFLKRPYLLYDFQTASSSLITCWLKLSKASNKTSCISSFIRSFAISWILCTKSIRSTFLDVCSSHVVFSCSLFICSDRRHLLSVSLILFKMMCNRFWRQWFSMRLLVSYCRVMTFIDASSQFILWKMSVWTVSCHCHWNVLCISRNFLNRRALTCMTFSRGRCRWRWYERIAGSSTVRSWNFDLSLFTG